jgi:hypothetical protein
MILFCNKITQSELWGVINHRNVGLEYLSSCLQYLPGAISTELIPYFCIYSFFLHQKREVFVPGARSIDSSSELLTTEGRLVVEGDHS